MTGYPNPSDESELRLLWKEVFNDTDEFIDSFFSRRYSVDSALIYREGGRIASMIFFPRYDFRIEREHYGLGYICGAATLPQYRGRGLMGQLIEASHEAMRERGDRFAALIPASDSLYGYYRRYGYHELFVRSRLKVNRDEKITGAGYTLQAADNTDLIYGLYLKGISPLSSVVIQSRTTFDAVVKEFRLTGGDILVSSDSSIYCFVRQDGKGLYVREVFGRPADKKVYPKLAAALMEHYPQVSSVDIEVPYGFAGPESETFRTGMGRGLTDEAGSLLKHVTGAYMKFMLED